MKWLRCHGRSPFMNWFMVWMSARQKSRLMVSTEKTTSTPDASVKFEASFVRWPVHCSSKISNLLLSPPWSNKGLLDVLMIKCAINFSRVTFVHVFCRKYPCPGACLILWHATINRAASKATAAGVLCQPSGQKILNKNHECEWLSEGKLEWLLIYRLLDNS